MAQPVSTQEMPSALRPQRSRTSSMILGGIAVVTAVLFAGAVVLWFHYGTAVFFEMIASGIAACF